MAKNPEDHMPSEAEIEKETPELLEILTQGRRQLDTDFVAATFVTFGMTLARLSRHVTNLEERIEALENGKV